MTSAGAVKHCVVRGQVVPYGNDNGQSNVLAWASDRMPSNFFCAPPARLLRSYAAGIFDGMISVVRR